MLRMMEIAPWHGKHWKATCVKHPISNFTGSKLQVTAFQRQHNEACHPRVWRRHLRRLEILDELSKTVPAARLQDFADPLEAGGWDHALPFNVPPLERARLKEEGLLPVAPEEYRREFPVGR